MTKPKPHQGISITPSPYYQVSGEVPQYMIRPRIRLMLADLARYKEAGSTTDRDRELCEGIVPLEEKDDYPRMIMLARDMNHLPDLPGKPCANDSLKTSPYCSRCKKGLKDDA